MEKLYMCTIVGSLVRDFVLIIFFQLYDSKIGLLEINLFWVSKYDPLNFHIGRRTNPLLI